MTRTLDVGNRNLAVEKAVHQQFLHLEFAMRTGRKFLRSGFTLVETVVTVGIISALAAVVYPTIVKQFDAADPTRAAEDLNNIRTGLEAFGVNVRPQQPGDIEDLVVAPSDSIGSPDVTSRLVAYSSSEAAAWLGPYLGISIPIDPAGADTAVTTGFGAAILNRLALYDINLNATGGDSVAVASIANADFIAVVIKGLSYSAFAAINALIDGPGESTEALQRYSGRLRCPGAFVANAACATAYFMASPVR